jgi:hypothetical protein
MAETPDASKNIKPVEVSDADLGIEPIKPASQAAHSAVPRAQPASSLLIHRQALPKDEVASDKPSSFESVAWAAENALAMRALSSELRGMGGIFGIALLCFAAFGFYFFFFLLSTVPNTLQKSGFFTILLMIVVIAAWIIGALLALTAAVSAFRNELQTPLDLPIVFNRKTRQVHVIAWDGGSKDWNTVGDLWRKWLSVFQRKQSEYLIYDWDSIEAHYQRETGSIGNTPKIVHSLRLVAQIPNAQGVMTQDTILIGNTLTHSEDTVKMQWEWLRRYMQEGGPVLYPGDKSAPALPNSLWQSLLATNPVWFISLPLIAYFGWWFYSRWDFSRTFMDQPGDIDGWFIVYALAAGFMLSWTFFNWLAHKVAPRLGDLPELRKDAGAAIELSEQSTFNQK